jgi:hypothetical protein
MLSFVQFINEEPMVPCPCKGKRKQCPNCGGKGQVTKKYFDTQQKLKNATQLSFFDESTLKEDDDDYRVHSGGRGIKGWMSPSGTAHLVPHDREHKNDHHPEYLKHHGGKQGDSLQDAQRKGFVRFGGNYSHVHGNHHFVHYDKNHPKGRETAIKALHYMKPHHDDPVTVSGSAGVYDREKGKRNATAMRQLGSSSVVKASHAMQLLKQGKSTAPKRPHA